MRSRLPFIRPLSQGIAEHVGLTWFLSFGGIALAIMGQLRLAGLAWFGLGAGAVGVAFARATGTEDLRFMNVRRHLDEKEVDFLLGHLPFLVFGLLALLHREDR